MDLSESKIELKSYLAYISSLSKHFMKEYGENLYWELNNDGKLLLKNCIKMYGEKSVKEFDLIFKTALKVHLYRKSQELMKPLSSWEEAERRFSSLVKYASKKVVGEQDYFLESQDLYQEGMLTLYNCWLKYGGDKGISEFKSIFTTSLFRQLRKVGKRKFKALDIDIEEIAESLVYTEDEFDQILIEYSVSQLYDILEEAEDEIALAILQELLAPSERTIWEMQMDVYRKRMLKQQGKQINLSKERVKLIHIRRALEITQKQFDGGIFRLRQSARQVFYAVS